MIHILNFVGLNRIYLVVVLIIHADPDDCGQGNNKESLKTRQRRKKDWVCYNWLFQSKIFKFVSKKRGL